MQSSEANSASVEPSDHETYDIVFINILDAPDNETISRISIELGSRGTIQLITLAAIPIDELEDSLLEKGWLIKE